MDKDFYNQSGCADPTAYRALKNVEESDKRVNFLIKVLKFIIHESGFELLNRIELREIKSGRLYK